MPKRKIPLVPLHNQQHQARDLILLNMKKNHRAQKNFEGRGLRAQGVIESIASEMV